MGASKLETGDPNMARTAMDGSICGRSSAYWGCAGAGHWYCGNLNLSILLDMFYSDPDLIKVHIVHDLKASQIDRYDFKDTKCLTEKFGYLIMQFRWEGSDISHLLFGYVCIWETKFMSNAIIMN